MLSSEMDYLQARLSRVNEEKLNLENALAPFKQLYARNL